MSVGSSLQVCFKNLSERTGCGIEVDGFDSNGGVLDWSKTETWEAVVQQARRRAWDVCFMMPPSSTYSRARHRQDGQHGGPKPLRNRLYLMVSRGLRSNMWLLLSLRIPSFLSV